MLSKNVDVPLIEMEVEEQGKTYTVEVKMPVPEEYLREKKISY